MIKTLAAAAALCCAAPAFAGINLVLDGSFESVHQACGTYSYYKNGISGWKLTNGPSIEVRNNVVGKAQDGVDFVELDSTANSGMSQLLDTVAGQTYTLSFYYSNRARSATYNGAFAGYVVPVSTEGLSYDLGGGAVTLGALAVNTTSDNVWTHYTTTFTATGMTTLSFEALGKSDSWGTSLDNVEVRAISVPEPAPLALMVGGLLLVAGLARRRAPRSARD